VPHSPQLIVTDLDGTIVRGDGTISERTIAAFLQAERVGTRFVFITSRSPRGLEPVIAGFGNQGTAICANGALVYDLAAARVVAERLITPGDLAAAAQALRAAVPGIGIAVEYWDGHVADDVYEPVTWELSMSIPRLTDEELFSKPGAKLLGRHMGYTPDELLLRAAPACQGIVTVSHSNGTSLIEANAIGVSKASAIAEFAASLGIGRESVVAFGDMPNDLAMLSWAGTSCAVANAHSSVLAAATHVIGGCADDGVAQFLEGLYGAGG
jgi:hydroxymethylpyrimidine pyrophosphatase-like HAD family hydrolase